MTGSVKWESPGLCQLPKGKPGRNGFLRFFSALDQSREEVREGFWQLEPVHSLGEEIVVKADETGMLVFPLGAETHLGTWCHEAPWGSWGLPTHSAALAGGNLSAGFGSSPSINPRMLCTEIKSASSLQRMGSPLPRESATNVQNKNTQGGQMKGRWERTHPSLWSKLANPRALVAERPESYLYHLRAP